VRGERHIAAVKTIVDKNIKKMILTKFDERYQIARKMEGRIIPFVTKDLNAQSKAIKNHEVLRCVNGIVELIISTITHTVNLEHKTCTYRAWQLNGKLAAMLWLFS
jgi:hypothetical protein